MLKQSNLKLFFATLIAIAIANNLDLATLASGSLQPKIDHQSAIAPSLNNTLPSLENQSEFDFYTKDTILAKKSGGRSGGGSFKSRPSRSKRSSPSRSSTQRKSNSPSLSSTRSKSTSPSYRKSEPSYRRDSSPNYYGTSSYRRRGGSFVGTIIFAILLLFFLGGLIFVLLYLLKLIFGSKSSSSDKTERKIIKERDNNRVTISLLQVALASDAELLQQDLSELSITADTDTEAGLVELMREAALILLRNDRSWTHVLSSSESLHIERAEQAFERLSMTERSKFSGETLSNVDGQLKTRQARNSSDSDGVAAYVVVTLILGTADDNPLFEKIYTEDNLREVLLKLSAMREDYLMKFELLWTPQTANEYLTDEELLMEYTEIMPL